MLQMTTLVARPGRHQLIPTGSKGLRWGSCTAYVANIAQQCHGRNDNCNYVLFAYNRVVLTYVVPQLDLSGTSICG